MRHHERGRRVTAEKPVAFSKNDIDSGRRRVHRCAYLSRNPADHEDLGLVAEYSPAEVAV